MIHILWIILGFFFVHQFTLYNCFPFSFHVLVYYKWGVAVVKNSPQHHQVDGNDKVAPIMNDSSIYNLYVYKTINKQKTS